MPVISPQQAAIFQVLMISLLFCPAFLYYLDPKLIQYVVCVFMMILPIFLSNGNTLSAFVPVFYYFMQWSPSKWMAKVIGIYLFMNLGLCGLCWWVSAVVLAGSTSAYVRINGWYIRVGVWECFICGAEDWTPCWLSHPTQASWCRSGSPERGVQCKGLAPSFYVVFLKEVTRSVIFSGWEMQNSLWWMEFYTVRLRFCQVLPHWILTQVSKGYFAFYWESQTVHIDFQVIFGFFEGYMVGPYPVVFCTNPWWCLGLNKVPGAEGQPLAR